MLLLWGPYALQADEPVKDSILQGKKTIQRVWLKKVFGIETSTKLAYSLNSSARSGFTAGQGSFNHIDLLQKVQYTASWKRKGIESLTSFDSELGILYLWDSLLYKHRDEQILLTELAIPLKKWLSASFRSSFETALGKGFSYTADDSGNLVKKPVSSLLTPLEGVMSIGIRISGDRPGKFYLGIPGLKVTYLMNRGLRALLADACGDQNPGTRSYKLEYGFCTTFDINVELLPQFWWECHWVLFKKNGHPPDLDVKNLFSYKGVKYFSTSLQTTMAIKSYLLKNMQVENLLTVGLSIERIRK
jgi:hypothetical protein